MLLRPCLETTWEGLQGVLHSSCMFVCMLHAGEVPRPEAEDQAGCCEGCHSHGWGYTAPPRTAPPAPPPPVPEPSMPPVAYGKAGPREFVLLVWLVCFIDALHAGPVGRDKAKVPGNSSPSRPVESRWQSSPPLLPPQCNSCSRGPLHNVCDCR